MKLRMILLMGIIVILFSSCSKGEAEEEKRIKSFLTNYYTWNKDDRYTKLSEGDMSDRQTYITKYLEPYYDTFKEEVTKEMLDKMIAGRMPLSEDKYAFDNQQTVVVKDVALESYDEEEYVYTYKVTLDVTQNGSSKTEEISGQISVNGNKEPILIKNFRELDRKTVE